MRTILLSAALALVALAPAARASTIAADAPLLEVAQTPTTPADDDEEDPSPGAKTPPPTPATPEKKDAPAAAPAGAVTPIPAATADQQKLVNGAPLYNPNVAVHIVEQKQFSDRRNFEVMLFPVVPQVNGKFTQHFGTTLGAAWHFHENFAFQASGFFNWVNQESSFNGELVEKINVEPQAASSLLNVWGFLAGVEVTPFYGKFAFYEGTLAHFSVVLNGGAGIGGTRHLLKPYAGTTGPATFGETGSRFLGELGGGFRLQIGKRWAVRLELRDVVYTARVDSVNGCTSADIALLKQRLDLSEDLQKAKVTGGCNLPSFGQEVSFEERDVQGNVVVDGSGKPVIRKYQTKDDVRFANNLIKKPSSDVLNNLGVYLGVSFNF